MNSTVDVVVAVVNQVQIIVKSIERKNINLKIYKSKIEMIFVVLEKKGIVFTFPMRTYYVCEGVGQIGSYSNFHMHFCPV